MNEEEKKAYDYLEKYVEWETLGERNLEGDIKTILNLIDKQQKQIKILNDNLVEERAFCKSTLETLKNCVDKDYLHKMISFKDGEIEKLKEEYQILKDDIEEHNVVYVDTPEFEEKYISKDKIKELIEKYKTEKNNMTQIVFSKYGKTQQAYKQVVYTNLIRVLEGLLSGQESDQEGGQEDE